VIHNRKGGEWFGGVCNIEGELGAVGYRLLVRYDPDQIVVEHPSFMNWLLERGISGTSLRPPDRIADPCVKARNLSRTRRRALPSVHLASSTTFRQPPRAH
jgi:hypothetical protein